MTLQKTNLPCQNCGQPVEAVIRAVIEVMKDPQGKIDLLSGRLNAVQCQNCGHVNSIVTPVLYHDATKELLLAYVPMELNLDKDQQERAIGDLMNQLPKDNFKAYMFQPKRALTMQGLIEQVLEADGITPEVMEQQKERVRRVQEIIDAPEGELPGLVAQYDAEIDFEFIQTFTLIAQRHMEGGQQQLAERAVDAGNRVMELSTAGQEIIAQQEQQEAVIAEVADTIRQLGQGATRTQFLDQAIEYADDEQRLQALVGLARSAFDYEFFQEVTTRIGQVPAEQREQLESLRERILEFTTAIDQQAQQAMQQSAAFLQALINHPDPQAMIEANIPMIDDTMMSILAANIQQAEQRGDAATSTRLKEIHQLIMQTLQANMQPELVFVNQLLSAPDPGAATALLQQGVQQFGPALLEVMEAVEQALEGQGNAPLKDRMSALREEAAGILQ